MYPIHRRSDDVERISLVAVTGLAGHAYGSWRHKDTKRMCLQEFLPKDTENNVQVIIYKHDSSLQGPSTNTAGIMDFIRNLIQEIYRSKLSVLLSNQLYERTTADEASDPTRLLLTMGHSLGCIIVGKIHLLHIGTPVISSRSSVL